MAIGATASEFLTRRTQNRFPWQPTQRELRPLAHPRPLRPRPRNKPKLPANLRHPLRHFLAILVRSISILRVPILVLLRQLREFLANKWQKLLGRGRHQEQHVRKEPLRPRFFRRRRQSFQFAFAICHPRYQGTSRNAHRQPSFAQLLYRRQTQIRTWRSWLQQTCQPGPQRRYRNVQRKFRSL